MQKKYWIAGLLLTAISLVMVACSGSNQPANSTATVDANAIYTQAAETVQAEMSLTEAAQPTATETPTVAPTSTIDPTQAAAFTATTNAVLQPASNTTPAAQTTPGAAGTGTPTGQPTAYKLPTATSAVVATSAPSTGDKATLTAQAPADGTNMPKSASFDMHLTLKNTGTTTWTTAYRLAFFAGERMNSPADFNLPHDVKPGESVTLVFTLTAPDSAGEKTIIWVMQNADGANFYPVYLKLNVTE